MSRAVTCKACFLKCDTGTTKHIFPFDEKSEHAKKPTAFVLQPLTTLFEMEIECECIHSKGNLFPLSNGVSGKIVQRIGRELFDLKARGDIFLNHPCIRHSKHYWQQLPFGLEKMGAKKKQLGTDFSITVIEKSVN